MKREIRVRMTYPHPPEAVWEALTDPVAIADWLMPNDFLPKVGHRFTMRTKPAPGFDGTVHCEVLVIDKPRRLSYSWKGGGIDTVVTFTLERIKNGTALMLEQTGFQGLRAIAISYILEKGWKKKILPASLLTVIEERKHTT